MFWLSFVYVGHLVAMGVTSLPGGFCWGPAQGI